MAGMKNSNKTSATVEYLDENTVVDRATYQYFLGIDPSYSSSGVVLLPSDATEIQPVIATTIKAGAPHQTFIERMTSLLNTLSELLKEYPSCTILTVMEGAAFASEFGAFKLGKLAGVLEYWLASNNYKYYLVAPTYVKKVASGTGNATKAQVINGVRARWGYVNKSNDINDAYTMARIAQGALPVKRKKMKKGKK